MEDKAEEAVQQIEWSDFKKLISNVNDEFTRLDEKRNTGQSIQKDLIEVYSKLIDSVYWPLAKAGHALMPREGENDGGDPDTALINALQMLEIQIAQRNQQEVQNNGISVQIKDRLSQMLNKIKDSID